MAATRPDPNHGDASSPESVPPKSVAPRSSRDPLLGRVISGRFRVLDLIARGGMGKVYRAEQAPLGRVCALKVLNPKYEGTEEPDFPKRFFLEASTAAKLTHQNTVTIFDYGHDESEGLYYIAMEYIQGKTLHRTLREQGAMHESRVAHIALQVCRSLREAHGLGVIHRDMKPANILLSNRGDEVDLVKVLDFGLVKNVTDDDVEELTKQGLFMGSPKYMAPEQILGNPVSRATDIYSLGVVLYEMLTGRVPFDRGGSVKTLMAHINEPPPSMTEHNPRLRISRAMEQLVATCLHKEPGRRYASIEELMVALARCEGAAPLTDSLRNAPMLPVAPAYVDVSGALVVDDDTSGPHGRGPLSLTGLDGSVTERSEASFTPGPEAISLVPTQGRGGGGATVPRLLAVGVVAVLGLAVVLVMLVRGGSDREAAAVVAPAPTASAAAPTPPPATADPQVEATATTAAEPVVTARRVLALSTVPPGAEVEENGRVVCAKTPCDITWQGDEAGLDQHVLTVTRAGFKPAEIVVKRDADRLKKTLVPDVPAGVARPVEPEGRPPATPPPPPPPAVPEGYKASPY